MGDPLQTGFNTLRHNPNAKLAVFRVLLEELKHIPNWDKIDKRACALPFPRYGHL